MQGSYYLGKGFTFTVSGENLNTAPLGFYNGSKYVGPTIGIAMTGKFGSAMRIEAALRAARHHLYSPLLLNHRGVVHGAQDWERVGQG